MEQLALAIVGLYSFIFGFCFATYKTPNKDLLPDSWQRKSFVRILLRIVSNAYLALIVFILVFFIIGAPTLLILKLTGRIF